MVDEKKERSRTPIISLSLYALLVLLSCGGGVFFLGPQVLRDYIVGPLKEEFESSRQRSAIVNWNPPKNNAIDFMLFPDRIAETFEISDNISSKEITRLAINQQGRQTLYVDLDDDTKRVELAVLFLEKAKWKSTFEQLAEFDEGFTKAIQKSNGAIQVRLNAKHKSAIVMGKGNWIFVVYSESITNIQEFADDYLEIISEIFQEQSLIEPEDKVIEKK